jgi:microcystin degradation protein MlrC
LAEAIRIAALNFVHETVTFLPNDTTLDDFVHDGSPARGEALLAWEPRSYIAGTFDPHGNEDAEFLRQADFAFCAKYFPHYDSRLQGERAARMLTRAIRGDYTPVSATVKVPILTATVLQWTGASPWMDLVQRALVWEAREARPLHERLLRIPVRRRAGCRHDGPGDDQRQTRACAQGR